MRAMRIPDLREKFGTSETSTRTQRLATTHGRMKKPLLLIAVPLVAALFSGCQTSSPSSGDDRFARADANHDGKLTQSEASDYFVKTIFASRDLNHDGKLTWEEWHVPGTLESNARFYAADTDRDGRLSLDEARAYGRQRGVFAESFRKADTNHDGYVTPEEARAYRAGTEGPPR